ncbi:hypothetical protein WA158_007638 [Blastocystis sp. Blastoise]
MSSISMGQIVHIEGDTTQLKDGLSMIITRVSGSMDNEQKTTYQCAFYHLGCTAQHEIRNEIWIYTSRKCFELFEEEYEKRIVTDFSTKQINMMENSLSSLIYSLFELTEDTKVIKL